MKSMKHIKKKVLNEFTKEEFEAYAAKNKMTSYKKGDDVDKLKKTKIPNNSRTILHTTKDKYFTGFIHYMNGKPYTFPEPDPTIIYFSSAQRFRRQIIETREKLLKNVDFTQAAIDDNVIEDLYNYYETVCGTVIFLFISLESFLNQLIPDDAVYKKEMKSKTETYNHSQIQEHISFGDKIKVVIPQLTSKDFYKTHPLKSQIIDQLKDFRDSIIHTKNENKNIRFDFIVKRSFTFDFDKAIIHTADFMNFHKADYIVECNCGKDF
jgi:hypothetical protein